MREMTLEELYASIDGDYSQALRVLRVEKLVNKHIRKLTKNGVVEKLIAAGESMDATELFESAHAAKGVCSNLGLVRLADLSSEIAEEFRPGNARKMSDAELAEKIGEVSELYNRTAAAIAQYEESN